MESCIGINETKAKDRSFEPEVIMSAIQSFPRIFNGISLKITFCYPKVVSNRGIFENLSSTRGSIGMNWDLKKAREILELSPIDPESEYNLTL